MKLLDMAVSTRMLSPPHNSANHIMPLEQSMSHANWPRLVPFTSTISRPVLPFKSSVRVILSSFSTCPLRSA